MTTEKCIPLHILRKITNEFSADSIIGTGGYGNVYEGVYNGRKIAVKLLHVDTVQGLDDQQFKNEVGNLLRVKHPNIVQLIGYCYETKKVSVQHNGGNDFSERIYRVLCFEYLQEGSLEKHLYEQSFAPNWSTRYNIIKGVCEGLNFLHKCEPQILHLDLKPANILLDSFMEPKVADLGLSRIFTQSHTHVTKRIRGSRKYVPPEYINEGIISPKNDVFSLGVVMIEIMTEPAGYSNSFEMGDVAQLSQQVLTKWTTVIEATSKYSSEEIRQVQICIKLAIRCVDSKRENRPTIADILDALNKTETHIPKIQRKVVITSPSGSTSIHSLMGVDKDIEVPRLEEDGARQLFNQYFGAQEDLYSDPHIGALAKDLVREIKGLPSELIHFGKVMKGQRDARQWEVIIEAVRKSNLRTDDTSCVVEKIVRNLEDRKEDLIAKRKDVNQTIEDAEREGKIPTNEVKRWLEKGDAIICDVDAISANYQLKKDVTMEAAEKLHDVKECLGSSPSTISVESGPRPVIEMPGPCMSAEDHNLQEALNFIKDDPTGMIGIWGPGGVGKTHLLNNINNSLDGDLTFDYVVYVTASRGCSVKKIQADIVCKLKLREDNNPESQRCIIFDFLKKKSFLVLLDDLWDRIELEAVGIPYPLGTVNQLKRKVVLTTRSVNVCGQMEVRKDLKVAYLQEDEAWQLFQEKVGLETLSSSPRIEVLAKELVKELNGLPLALITIGRTMYAKTRTAQWEYAIQCMRQSRYDKDDLLGMEKAVFSQLKFSYDSLRTETLRHCFCISALWPDSDWILEKEVAHCLIHLGLVEVDEDIQNSYRKAYSLLGALADACLIDRRENWDGSFSMHDVVRDMAHWIFSENNDRWFVRAGVGTEKNFSVPWNKAEYISLMQNRMKKLPPVCSSQCPMKLRMLCLGGNDLDESTIAEEIKKFTSLTYLDLRYNELKKIPEELCSLPNLEHLDLSRNRCIEEVPQCFRNLIKLKFLYLKETGIKKIPEGVISSLISLLVIDLRVNYSRDFISSRLFKELVMLPHLKAVDINNVHILDQYESLRREGANLPIRYLKLQIEGLARCKFDILSHDCVRKTLYVLAIEVSLIEEIIVRPYCFATLNKLSLIDLDYLREIKFMGTSPASLFPLLTCLKVEGCVKLKDLSWAMYLPLLEQLVVERCEKMRQAFRSHHRDNKFSGQQSSQTFPCLKYLCLDKCKLLVTIGDSDVAFPSLEKLVIVGCLKLKTLPFQMDSLRKKLRVLEMDVASWDRLELEEGMKSFLQTKRVNAIWFSPDEDSSEEDTGESISSDEDRSEEDIGERSPIPADEDRSEEDIAASILYAIAHDIGLAS